jgi:hypothetical protein
VKSEENPADYASRGIRSTEELNLKIWRQGPAFLWADKCKRPAQPEEISTELTGSDFGVREEEIAVNMTHIAMPAAKILEKDCLSTTFYSL